MPIEIKELHIRVSVNAASNGVQPSGARTAAADSNPGSDDAKDAIVAECVEQVLHILQNKQER
jgi:hypothetical protein